VILGSGIVAVVALIALHLIQNFMRDEILHEMRSALGGQVELEQIRLRPAAVAARGFTWIPDLPEAPASLSLDELRVKVGVGSLFSGYPTVHGATIRGVELELRPDGAGGADRTDPPGETPESQVLAQLLCEPWWLTAEIPWDLADGLAQLQAAGSPGAHFRIEDGHIRGLSGGVQLRGISGTIAPNAGGLTAQLEGTLDVGSGVTGPRVSLHAEACPSRAASGHLELSGVTVDRLAPAILVPPDTAIPGGATVLKLFRQPTVSGGPPGWQAALTGGKDVVPLLLQDRETRCGL